MNIKEKVLLQGDKFRALTAHYPIHSKQQATGMAPFFIISAGRSGSTLLRTILVRGKEVNIPPETNDILTSAYVFFFKYMGKDWEHIVKSVYDIFEADTAFQYWSLDRDTVVKQLLAIPEKERSLAKLIDVTYRAYGGQPELYWGDKTPFLNLRIPYILNIFPNAKFIHIIRDGRDVVASRLKSLGDPNIAASSQRWLDSLAQSEIYQKKLPASQWMDISYEDMVSQPSEIVEQVCSFLGIEYSDDMLDSQAKLDLGDTKLQHHANTKKPISTASIGKWKAYFNDQEKAELQQRIGAKLQEYGYK